MDECGLCGEPFNPQEGEEGYCPDCLRRAMEAEEDALRHEWFEAMKVIDMGGPWY
jgi:hypothetical protein